MARGPATARRRRRWAAGVLVTGIVPALVVIGLTGVDAPEPPPSAAATTPSAIATPTPNPTTPPPPSPSALTDTPPPPVPTEGEALAVLETLPVKGRAPKTGYDRDQFGPAWADTDGNGCDTRNDILARDLTEVVTDGCTVVSGLLADPYSRTWIWFTRGTDTSSLVQIDHVVSLSDAWQKGAQQLTPAQRERFANDPVNLLAVDGSLNQQKSDGDAATWLPPNKEYRCEMVARQVAVKARHGLWVTQAEKDAIGRILATCPGEPMPHGTAAPRVAPDGPAPAQTRASSPGTSGDTADTPAFANCAAARAAGAAPVLQGEPGYGRHLDRDGDGVGCE